jgi:hypothetical protein
MNSSLLAGLHENLWASLRHTFNTDRILLGVTYLVNFAAFILLLVLLPEKLTAGIVSLVCLVLLNVLIFLSLRNSQLEVTRVLATLQQIYKDNDLGQYFEADQSRYYSARYRLWLILQPSLMVFAVVIAGVVTYVA